MEQKIKNVITDKIYMTTDANKANENGIQFQIVKRGETFFVEEARLNFDASHRIYYDWGRPFFKKGNAHKTYEEAFEVLKTLVQFEKDNHAKGEVIMQWMSDSKIEEKEKELAK